LALRVIAQVVRAEDVVRIAGFAADQRFHFRLERIELRGGFARAGSGLRAGGVRAGGAR
jgi:hypothetical protein